jgi:hypothetical protein
MKSAALAAEELTEQVSHRLMALADEHLVSNALSEGTEVVPDIHIYDDVLPDPEGYRALALVHSFQTFVIGNVEWHGFAECEPSGLTDWLQDTRPDLTATLSLLRQSPDGQEEPHYIHTDRSMGDWSAILYLTPSPKAGDGTDFWRHRWSGVTESCAESATEMAQEAQAWSDQDQWSLRQHVASRFNRVVLFPAEYFHSRSLHENYGSGETARLTQIVFCEKKDT